MTDGRSKVTEKEALEYHAGKIKGKLAVCPTKPLDTQRDLSLAYSPGVAYPCLAIQDDYMKSYEYTSKGNTVAVITNGTAVLGLGNLGALASKPVMEGKAVLFKRFADVDATDIEVETEDPQEFINCVKLLGATWGGINLEDIKAPECFVIEEKLKELMDIPVFHDDQHGTAIVCLAGLINAVKITNRSFSKLKIVVNGAGAAAIACIELIKLMGTPHDNIILCDTAGVIYKGRKEKMNPWKEKHAVETKCRTLNEAMKDADVFLGLSVAGAVSKDMVVSMADHPVIFTMANPVPEILPDEVEEVRDDAIIATGRSDYPNQVNNVMVFPYLFRGALDVKAKVINNEMKLAAAQAIATLAREHVLEEVTIAYSRSNIVFGPKYIIPSIFDPRLITIVPPAVAQAAINSGAAGISSIDMGKYKQELEARLNPTANIMNFVFDIIRNNPQKIIFAEGEEEQIVHTAALWRDQGYGTPILVGRESTILEVMKNLNVDPRGIEITNAGMKSKEELHHYTEMLYKKLQRKGYLYRDCVRMVNGDRNIFSACMLECNEGDAIVSGVTRGYTRTLNTILNVIDIKQEHQVCGISLLMAKGQVVFIADTTVHEKPTAEQIADITIQTANKVRNSGYEPRVALLSFSTFGNPPEFHKAETVREALSVLDSRNCDFEYDGEMAVDVALNDEIRKKLYPFSRLTKSANILIMPALHSANISSKLMQEMGGGSLIGPFLNGLRKSVQITQMGASVSDILNLTAIAAIDAINIKEDTQ